MLDARWRAYRTLPPLHRAAIDAVRIVPTPELHDILTHFLMFDRFADEPEAA